MELVVPRHLTIMDVKEHLQPTPPNQVGDHPPYIHNLNKALNKVGSKHLLRPTRRENNHRCSGAPHQQGFIVGTAWEVTEETFLLVQDGSLAISPKVHAHREVLVRWLSALRVGIAAPVLLGLACESKRGAVGLSRG